jgi:heme exporter protein A
LIVERLGCQRGGRMLFRDLSFRLDSGDLVTLTGPNGSGKSTMMRIVAGLTPLEEGSVRLEGAGEDTDPAHHLHYHGHREALRDALTARENLTFATALLGGDVAAVPAALERLGARRLADLPVRVLSAGQRRRVALCRLITVPRTLWLLDEPLAALDVAGQALVAELIAEHVGNGGAALVATHQPLGITGKVLDLGTAPLAAAS